VEWVSRPHLPEWAELALSASRLKSAGLLSPIVVTALRRDVLTGQRDKSPMLMNVLTLQTRIEMFVGTPLAKEPPQPATATTRGSQ